MRNSVVVPIISELEKQGLEVTRCLRKVRMSVKERYSTMRLDVNGELCSLHHVTSCQKEKPNGFHSTINPRGWARVKLSPKTRRAVSFIIVRLDIKDVVDRTLVVPVIECAVGGSLNFTMQNLYRALSMNRNGVPAEWNLKNCRSLFEAR